MSRRAKLILNPIPWAQRAWSKLPEMVNLLEDADIHADLTFTKMNETMTKTVEQAAGDGYDLVIAGGGDGTVSEVAAGLVGTGVPLGILPFGTYNNIAHSLGIPLDLSEAAYRVARGRTIDIDVGVANGVYFFEAVGVGLDATLFPIGEEIKGGHYEKLAKAAMTFLRHRKADIELLTPKHRVRLRSPMVVVANGPYYGAGIQINPGADLSDGLLEVVTFECNKMEVALHFALNAQHRQYEQPCVVRLQVDEVKIDCSLPLPAHADGKPIGTCPVSCKLIPESLRVIVP
ncbi:MAG: diacylglycerol kinase family lipid kinase [Chloroflexi bacterium]|nr:diacylglycerol kinase family lipid kinase [Chloroflexota bacterium]